MQLFRTVRTTLSLERDVARLLVVEDDAITRWGSTRLPPDAIVNDYLVDPEAVGAAVRTLLERHDAPTRDLYVTLPPGESSVRLVTLQPGDPVNDDVVQRIASRFWTLETSAIGWQVLRRNGQRRLFLLQTPNESVDRIVEALTAAGVQPAALEPKALALMRAVGEPYCVIVDLEHLSITVVVVDDALPTHVTTWPLQAPLLATPQAKVTRAVEALIGALDDVHHAGPADPLATRPVVCTGAFGGNAYLQTVLESTLQAHVVHPTLPESSDVPVQQYMANFGLVRKRR